VNSAPNRVFYKELEALRGLAALSVCLFHISEQGPHFRWENFERYGFGLGLYTLLTQALTNGGGAVLFFFVLSGFVMGTNMDPLTAIKPRALLQFWIKRGFRLLPATLFAVLFSAAIGAVFFDRVPSWSNLSSLLTLKTLGFNGPLWSLRVEIAGSVLYPALFLFGRLLSPQLQLIVLIFLFRKQLPGLPWVDTDLTTWLRAFYIGLLIQSIGKPVVQACSKGCRIGLLVAALAAYFMATPLTAAYIKWNVHGFNTIFLIQAVASFYVIAYCAFGPGLSFLRTQTSQFLGWVSFSVYLIHYPLVLVGNDIAARYVPTSFIAKHVVLLCTVVPLTLILATFITYLIERPMTDLGRRLAARVPQLPETRTEDLQKIVR
jgi:peptidoglycan/LPS O-acetylase OafA/YrhL